MNSKRIHTVNNAEDLCAQAGVDTLDELGGLIPDLAFEIIVRPDEGSGGDFELFAPSKGRGQGEYWPSSWPELQQSIHDFQTLLQEEEEEELRQSFEEPDNPPVVLPALAGAQRLHLIAGSPWWYALGDFMANASEGEYWLAPDGYARGDLLLSVLDTWPRVLLCLERASTKPSGGSIMVDDRGLYFPRVLPMQVIEERAGVTLPEAPATLRKRMASAVLDAIATELSNPTDWIDSDVGWRSETGCNVPTGIQAAALMAAEGVCQACGREYGALLDGRGIAGLEVHDLPSPASPSQDADDNDADSQSERRAELSAKTLAALRKLAIAAGFVADEVSTADRKMLVESLLADELGLVEDGEDEFAPGEEEDDESLTRAERQGQFDQKDWNRPQAMYSRESGEGTAVEDEIDIADDHDDELAIMEAMMGRGDEMDRFAVLCGGCHLLAHSTGSPSVEAIRLAWRPACPACGAHPPNAIMWGLPAGPVDDPHITYGGCMVYENPPARWHCTHCGHQWGP